MKCLNSFQHDFRDRVLRRMRQRQMRGRCARLFVEFPRPAMQQQQRRARFFRRNFNVLPTNAAAPTGLQRLQRRFFCGETRCIMLRSNSTAPVAVFAFGVGEHTFSKTRRARQHFLYAPDFDDVYANGNNHSG